MIGAGPKTEIADLRERLPSNTLKVLEGSTEDIK